MKEIPAGSRANKERFLKSTDVERNLPKIRALNAIAEKRGQSLAEMSLAWVLRLPVITSALVGASSIAQLEKNLNALNNLEFTSDELTAIDAALK